VDLNFSTLDATVLTYYLFDDMKPYDQNFDLLHDIAPGKHFYQFYKSPQDLLKVLVPYWHSGVRHGNFCFWAIPSFMTVAGAFEALTPDIPNIGSLIQSRRFEIVTHSDWYGDGETFDGNEVIKKYTGMIEETIRRGFSTIRIAGDTSGFQPHLWDLLQEYECIGQSQIDTMPCIALCSYPLHDLRLQQTKDVLDHHHGVLIARV